ncbi:diguanylate cyclase [Legionella impletisoli]|uniref:diguanylate cyclase n=1 Tax=Legionella impletisoli TaxID=343510 RepID=A0A917NC02_9GAMM|nr:diguanylate cyclase [Legionella impletisoli]GGI82265.1 sensor histidine kinase [Legionella impletisoli]
MNEPSKHPSLIKLMKDKKLSQTTLNIIFIVALLSAILFSFVSYKQIQILADASQSVVHTYKVIDHINSALYRTVELESQQRGYLISGQEHFLEDFAEDVQDLKQELNQLDQLTAENKEQNKRVQAFIILVEERIDILSRVVLLKHGNKLFTEEGTNLLNRSQEMSSRVKGLGQEIRSVEYVLLKERNEAKTQNAEQTSHILLLGSVISVAFLLFAFLLVNFEIIRRRETERKHHQAEVQLRKIIESSTDMIAAFDKQDRFIMFNDNYFMEFKRLFGKKIEVGMTLQDALSNVPANQFEFAKDLENSLQNEINEKTIECMVQDEKRVYELSSAHIKDHDPENGSTIHTLRDITKRLQEHAELQASYKQLTLGMKILENKNQQITLLVEMSDIMLACGTQQELAHVVETYSKKLMQFASGYLYIMHPSRNFLEKILSWGAPIAQEITFTPQECWGIRLGRIHQVDKSHHTLVCEHIEDKEKNNSMLCIPLMAQNDIYGLFYLESEQDTLFEDENQRLLIIAFSELIALALANVRLRENLRHQSVRDPLTGLYNRRYLDDFLCKLINQSQRTESPISVMMLDLDHFKKINDTFGHDAGDAVLKEVGQIIENSVRDGDIAARFGGEEFVIIFYDIDLESTRVRAEAIRKEVSQLQIKYGAQIIGPITISIGISAFPVDGNNPNDLIDAADKALYYSKNHGRNQVSLYSNINIEGLLEQTSKKKD